MSDIATTKTGNLPVHIASAACYVPFFMIGLVASLVFFFTEPPENTEIRFHATQSLFYQVAIFLVAVLGGILMAVGAVAVGILGSMAEGLAAIGGLVLGLGYLAYIGVIMLMSLGNLVLAVMCFLQKNPHLPVIGPRVEARIAAANG